MAFVIYFSLTQHKRVFVSFRWHSFSNIIKTSNKGGNTMNTDKIYAEHLANEYAPKDDSKVIALRKLDSRAKLPATVFTYSLGILSALIAGVGMCLSMNVIGNGSSVSFVLGVIIGLIGLAGMGINFPVYKKMLAKGKQKYAFEIMELAKEISGE